MLIYETSYSISEHPKLIDSIYIELSKGNNKHTINFLYAHEKRTIDLENKEDLIKTYGFLSEAFIANNYLDSSLSFAHKALSLSKKLANPLITANSNVILGKALFNNYKLDSANNLLFETLGYLEKNHTTSKYLADCYSTIGNFFFFLGTPRKAIEFNNKALEVYEKLNNTLSIAKCHYSIGNAHLYLENNEKAKLFFNSSIVNCEKHDDIILLSANYYSMAEVENALNNDSIAKAYIHQAILIDKELESIYGLAYDYLLLGEIYFDIKAFALAKETLLTSLQYSKAIVLSEVTLSSLYYLVDIEYDNKNYKEALDYNKEINEIRDSLIQNVDFEKLQDVEKQYQAEKQVYIFELDKHKAHFKITLLIIALCFLVIIAIFLWFIQRIKSKKQNIEQGKLIKEINFKNKQLTTNVMCLANKNEFITSISKKIDLLKTQINNSESTQILNELAKEIQYNLNDEFWKEFEMRFQDVHVEFYNNLNKQFPDLTKNERRLAAFLKLNMTTKEISAITNQSATAVEMARSRLRKKLNIQNSNLGLPQFLNQF